MRIAGNQNLGFTLSKAEQACKLMREVGKNTLADELDGLIKGVREQRFVIGVVGSAKRGKSTMINGLLGRRNDDCAPIGKFPATNVVSIFGHSENPSAKVIFSDNPAREITEHEIRLYVTEEHSPGNRKNVRSVEVLGPFAGLEMGSIWLTPPAPTTRWHPCTGNSCWSFYRPPTRSSFWSSPTNR